LIEVQPSTLHFRMLRIDDQIFSLDIGTSDAGKYPTLFTPVPSQPQDHQILDDVIGKGAIIHRS